MTQPTISKSLKQLEDEIGLPLFHKGEAGRKREVKLTYGRTSLSACPADFAAGATDL